MLVPAALAVGLVACDIDDILDVDDPDVASPETIRDPSALPSVFAGVVRDFTWAYSGTGSIGGGGDNDPLIMLTGLFTDELRHYGTFPTRQEIDRRAIPTTAQNNTADNGTISDAYHNLHRARRAADIAEELYAEFDVGNTRQRAIVSALNGYAYILFGEVYCEGVPYSSISLDGMTVTYGEPSTRQQTFDLAIARFDRAIEIAQAAGATDALNLARVGKARAQLNLGQFAQAAATVADVPDDFVFNLQHSANSAAENNGVWRYSLDTGRYGVADGREAGEGLDFTGDPRTPVLVGTRDPFDTSLPIYIGPNKYPTRDTPVPLADGIEVRFIRAEAALHAGDVDAFRTHLNAVRAMFVDEDGDPLVPQLAAGDIPASEAGRVDLLFEERGYSMWLTGKRLGDLRRLVRQYGRDQADVFPSGEFFRDGLNYGSDVNFPIFVDENNNPNFTGCLNRDA